MQEQTSTPTFYKMELRFKLTLGLKKINEITEACGIDTKVVAKGITMKLKQVVPFIPDEETIEQYTNIIKKKYASEEFTCEECVFDGYNYLQPISADELKKLQETAENKDEGTSMEEQDSIERE